MGNKNVPLYLCQYLRQLLTNFQKNFNVAYCGQLAIKLLLNIPPHFNCVTTLPRET